MPSTVPPSPGDLCISCGLCCDGTVFANVPVGSDEEQAVRAVLNNATWLVGRQLYFRQPCTAFCGSCTVYPDRPEACRLFKCRALKSVEQETQSWNEARAQIIEVMAARADVIAASRCASLSEAKAQFASHCHTSDGTGGPVPPFAFELLVMERLLDLYIRDDGYQFTMGRRNPDAMPPPA